MSFAAVISCGCYTCWARREWPGTPACAEPCMRPLTLPDRAFAAPPVVPALTVTRLAAQVTERLAVLDRVRPILSEAIHAAEGDVAIKAATQLAVRITTAILKE